MPDMKPIDLLEFRSLFDIDDVDTVGVEMADVESFVLVFVRADNFGI